jgi:hypothetical protein
MEFFIHRAGVDYGPFSADDVKGQLAAGTILPSDYVWFEGEPDWAPISSLKEFADSLPRRQPLAPTIRLQP